jgi:hypothetical protein
MQGSQHGFPRRTGSRRARHRPRTHGRVAERSRRAPANRTSPQATSSHAVGRQQGRCCRARLTSRGPSISWRIAPTTRSSRDRATRTRAWRTRSTWIRCTSNHPVDNIPCLGMRRCEHCTHRLIYRCGRHMCSNPHCTGTTTTASNIFKLEPRPRDPEPDPRKLAA